VGDGEERTGLAKGSDEVLSELEGRVEAIGYEVVEVAWGGTAQRPILKLRIDRPDTVPGAGITVAECARVSRELEPWLDEDPRVSERYMLEVSSPGVERPLRRRRDFVRFSGQDVRVRRRESGGRKSVLTGLLLRVEGAGEGEDEYAIVLQVGGADEVAIPIEAVVDAKLVFRWEDG